MNRIRAALKRWIDRVFPSQSPVSLLFVPDYGDDWEWMGGGFIWEPGDLDTDEESGR